MTEREECGYCGRTEGEGHGPECPDRRPADRPTTEEGRPPTNVAGGPLLEQHDPGCRCWPHVAQADAIKAVEHAALMEYRSSVAGAAPRAEGLDVELIRTELRRASALVENSGRPAPPNYREGWCDALDAAAELIDAALAARLSGDEGGAG